MIVKEITRLRRDKEVQVEHMLKEGNGLADFQVASQSVPSIQATRRVSSLVQAAFLSIQATRQVSFLVQAASQSVSSNQAASQSTSSNQAASQPAPSRKRVGHKLTSVLFLKPRFCFQTTESVARLHVYNSISKKRSANRLDKWNEFRDPLKSKAQIMDNVPPGIPRDQWT
ncbi:hypothetical protein RND71_025013 [Anisodus tanguticus]|uniref:Uncharacterized protein n=1 Tax=Anisodus tanguticus TaxID=243964 RepID=A0AAE1RS94_9SOLA|nr:hypothetical protein RND71_025013 [Anisodus tanguticus]